jgi:hypothetical protein
LAQYKSLPHVGVTSANTGHSEIDDWMTRKGIARDIHLHVPHFVAVGHILQSSDLIATVPERFAQKCQHPFQLEISPLPFKLPDIAISLFWHAKYNRELPRHLERFRRDYERMQASKVQLPTLSQLSPRTRRKMAVLPPPNEAELQAIEKIEQNLQQQPVQNRAMPYFSQQGIGKVHRIY